ncbi:histidine kinase dimerization/phospho-acceptor domain-containing protein [Kineobactrum salinum]|uniref:histidine kinase n=1 Tax=Kineobactrum salinum TaxID=2708301 RepID=A0A6C0U0P2_9GAMM|nr:histidine kinase dimerization/phospho-acceptor domain-containing protein [Kineobactrum salinum]QIB65682.1 HAMP domain-containing protein [Kineobactrum salinum]
MTTQTSLLARFTGFLGGLQRTLLLFVALPLIVVAALSIRIGFEQANRFQENLLKGDLELIARAIQIPVADALAAGNTETLEKALASVFTIGKVYSASVFDVDGRRVAAAGTAGGDLTHSTIPQQLAASGEMREEYGEVEGRQVFSHFLPLFDETGQTKGFIQITRRHDDFTDALSHLTWLAWGLWFLLAVAITSTVLIGHYRGIGRHVGGLLEDMAKVEQGSLDHRIRTDGPSEVAAMARGLNSMLDGIQRSDEALRHQREEEQRLLLQLKDSEKMAAIGRVTRGFAHELGAPLSVIDGRARRLEKYHGSSPDSLRELSDIRRQIQHLAATVRNLLEYSRPAAERIDQVPVEPLLQSMAGIIAAEHEEGAPLSRCKWRKQYLPSGATSTACNWRCSMWFAMPCRQPGPGWKSAPNHDSRT